MFKNTLPLLLRRAKATGFFALIFGLLAPASLFAAFGLTTTTDLYTVDTGAGLVFSIRRTEPANNQQTQGDISSLVFNGVEYQDQVRGSQVGVGLGGGTVTATTYGTSYIKIAVTAPDGGLTHYYMARNGYPHIYMATYFTSEPSLTNCRFITRIPLTLLPNGPTPSDIHLTTTTVESSDIFALSNGQTRSKHYSNHRLIDWSFTGATGTNVGVWMVRDSNEGGSGGPFYRCLINQGGADQEIYNMVNYGEAQTEASRTGMLNGAYTLVLTTRGNPPTLDTSWVSGLGLTGYVAAAGRGNVVGVGLAGRDTNYQYVVGFANTKAQYWTIATSTGSYGCYGMIPGTYTQTVYKGELAVWTGSVTVAAGASTSLHTITIANDPSTATAIWRIGNWDGKPTEFLNGANLTTMHPSDPRMSSWGPVTYTVGSSAATTFPAYQWKAVNNATTVKFTLTAAQVAAHTVRIGITAAYAGGRPQITVNSWTSPAPSASTQPDSRSLTIGSYRENNTTYTYAVPATAFVSGANTLTISVISGSGSTGFLSAGYSYDCVDLL